MSKYRCFFHEENDQELSSKKKVRTLLRHKLFKYVRTTADNCRRGFSSLKQQQQKLDAFVQKSATMLSNKA